MNPNDPRWPSVFGIPHHDPSETPEDAAMRDRYTRPAAQAWWNEHDRILMEQLGIQDTPLKVKPS